MGNSSVKAGRLPRAWLVWVMLWECVAFVGSPAWGSHLSRATCI